MILQSSWESLPSHTELERDGKLVQKTISLLEVCIGKHTSEICSVSHCSLNAPTCPDYSLLQACNAQTPPTTSHPPSLSLSLCGR